MTHTALERLVAMAAGEQNAIDEVLRAVRLLEETQEAKAQLQRLPADVIRAALEARARTLASKATA